MAIVTETGSDGETNILRTQIGEMETLVPMTTKRRVPLSSCSVYRTGSANLPNWPYMEKNFSVFSACLTMTTILITILTIFIFDNPIKAYLTKKSPFMLLILLSADPLFPHLPGFPACFATSPLLFTFNY